MPKLLVKKGSGTGDEIRFDPEQTLFTIGSNEASDCVVAGRRISPTHAKIEKIDGDYYLVCGESEFETRLNGLPVLIPQRVVDGDEIAIGEFHLYFRGDTNLHRDEGLVGEKIDGISTELLEEEFPGHGAPRSSKSGGLVAEPPVAQPPEPAHDFYELDDLTDEMPTQELERDRDEPGELSTDQTYYLQAVYGPYLGKSFPLNFGETKIGRDSALNDIVIRQNESGGLDPSISRRHTTINFKDNKFFVSDKRSLTRTFVNQLKLGASDEVPVTIGDEIEIVSDQKSTIFRLTSESRLEIAPPRKAGIWWIRNNLRVGTILSLILGIVTVAALATSYLKQRAINTKPAQLELIERTLLPAEGSTSGIAAGNYTRRPSTFKAGLALGDLDGDDHVDIVFTDAQGYLKALNSTTKLPIWRNDQSRVLTTIPLVSADLNENGLPDLLVVGQDARLRAIDGSSGAEIWVSPILGENISGPPAVTDFDADGLQDVIIATKAGQVHIGHGSISRIEWQTIETGMQIHATPSSGDWDDDGINEVLLGTEKGKVLVVDGQLGKIEEVIDFDWELSKAGVENSRGHSIRSPIALTDLNQNQQTDLLIGSTAGAYLSVEGINLGRVWHEQVSSGPALGSGIAPVVADCNSDEVPDVVLVSARQVRVVQFSPETDQRQKILWQFDLEEDAFNTSATIADLDKDEADDVIIGTWKGTVFVLSGRDGTVISKIYSDRNPSISPLLAADLGGDGYLDLVHVRKDRQLYAIESNSTIAENSVVWGQTYGDAQHSCRYSYVSTPSAFYDVMMAGSGLLFCVVLTLTVSAKRKRVKMIRENQLD